MIKVFQLAQVSSSFVKIVWKGKLRKKNYAITKNSILYHISAIRCLYPGFDGQIVFQSRL